LNTLCLIEGGCSKQVKFLSICVYVSFLKWYNVGYLLALNCIKRMLQKINSISSVIYTTTCTWLYAICKDYTLK
jgi:hypothetical protein